MAKTARGRMIAAIHAEAKSRGLEDDDRRALMKRETGKDSCKAMNPSELGQVLAAMKGRSGSGTGKAALPDNAYGGKLRALWISAYWLGVVEDRTDAALAAFIKRQTGLDSARFLHAPEDAEKAIEAIKDWLAREAGVSWESYSGHQGRFEDPRARVIEAQWHRLANIGAVKIADGGALTWWLRRALKLPGHMGATQIADRQKDEAIRKLGGWLRRELEVRSD